MERAARGTEWQAAFLPWGGSSSKDDATLLQTVQHRFHANERDARDAVAHSEPVLQGEQIGAASIQGTREAALTIRLAHQHTKHR